MSFSEFDWVIENSVKIADLTPDQDSDTLDSKYQIPGWEYPLSEDEE